jgi:hypothetical protein
MVVCVLHRAGPEESSGFFFDCLTLKMKALQSSETSVAIYLAPHRNVQEYENNHK